MVKRTAMIQQDARQVSVLLVVENEVLTTIWIGQITLLQLVSKRTTIFRFYPVLPYH